MLFFFKKKKNYSINLLLRESRTLSLDYVLVMTKYATHATVINNSNLHLKTRKSQTKATENDFKIEEPLIIAK
jgi:hypothetical protein